MKSQSLLSARSNLSNLSQLSNVSYHGEKKQYIGSEFFRESLPPGHNQKLLTRELKQQQIQLDSLGIGVYKNFTPIKQCPSAFTPFWTSQLHPAQGTSDNENQGQHPQIKQQPVYPQPIYPQPQYFQMPYSQMAYPQIHFQEPKIKHQQQIKAEYPSTSFTAHNPLLHKQKKEQVMGLSEQEESEESEEERGGAKLDENNSEKQKVLKNQTKNIPKNYGKAIIIFIQNNRDLIEGVLHANGDNYERLLLKLRALKKKINTISDLRNLWENQEESKSLRTISNNFLRKHSLHYIYNSRIKTRLCHAKYKRRLQEAILNPQDFNHIKDY